MNSPPFTYLSYNYNTWYALQHLTTLNLSSYVDNIGETARNRFGRPYISGRPLLACDRQKIITMFNSGVRKIEIARTIGVTHSCVSKVIRRFEQTGRIDVSKESVTASCACPCKASEHNPLICRHLRYRITKTVLPKTTTPTPPKIFSIDWILQSRSTPCRGKR